MDKKVYAITQQIIGIRGTHPKRRIIAICDTKDAAVNEVHKRMNYEPLTYIPDIDCYVDCHTVRNHSIELIYSIREYNYVV